jgi:hypothetical protein
MHPVDTPSATQRLEVLLARAKIGVLAAHAHAARSLIEQLGDRLAPDAVLSIYCTRQRLPPGEARYVALHALARLRLPHETPEPLSGADLNGHTRSHADGGLARGFRWIRDQVAPLADPELRARVEIALARARTTLIVLHVRHALRFAAALGEKVSAHTAVALYLDELEVEFDFRAAVYALAVARASGFLAALPTGTHVTIASGEREDDTTMAPALQLRH